MSVQVNVYGPKGEFFSVTQEASPQKINSCLTVSVQEDSEGYECGLVRLSEPTWISPPICGLNLKVDVFPIEKGETFEGHYRGGWWFQATNL